MFTIDGLASGLDTTSIIAQILEIQRRPIDLINEQIELQTQRQTAFLDLSARLLNLQLSTDRLSSGEAFEGVTVNSSNEDALLASASSGVPAGVYTFRPVQLASTSQFVSSGFADTDSTAVGAGTLTLELGAGFIDPRTELDDLNGGAGISRGSIRITDRDGNSQVVDLRAAVTVQDAITAINDTAGLGVTASVAGSIHTNTGAGIVLEDTTGGAGTLTVDEVSGGSTASDLGILGSAVATTLEGSRIQYVGGSTLLAQLGDGLGLRGEGTTGFDLTITDKTGTDHEFDVEAMTTVQDLIDAVNDTGALTLAVNVDGDGFDLTDTTGGGGALTVADTPNSTAATDLGLAGTTAGATINGSRVYAGIDDLLLGTLNGGTGVDANSIDIIDRLGGTTTVDLSTAETVQDVLRAINDSAAPVVASIDPEGNGLQIRDTSGGTLTLEVQENGGTTAADLGILGTASDDRLNGSDLDPRYFHLNTNLNTLNGGRGVADGTITITDSNGITFNVNLNNNDTVRNVIVDIEGAASAAGSDLTVGINASGNGLLLDSATGSGTLSVAEVGGGTTAADLHIVGSAPTASPGTIDGAFEESITISATDTLDDVLEAVDALNIDATASIVNDGSAVNPFRLSLVSGETGRLGRLGVDATGGTKLTFSRTAEASDAILFYGDTGGGAQPLLIRSSSNTFTDVIEGLTVTAQQSSTSPVQVSVQEDTQGVVDAVGELVEKVNDVLTTIGSLTGFDAETEERGLLLGDGTVNTLRRTLINRISSPLSTVSNGFTVMAEIGIRVRSGRVVFDSSKFREALDSDPQAVRTLFSASRPFEDNTRLEDFKNGSGVRSKEGDDFRISLRDGTDIDVDISAAVTLQDVIDAINTAGGGSVSATYLTTRNSIEITDTTAGPDPFRITVLNNSGAAFDLGIERQANVSGGDTITGSEVDLSGDVGVAARLTDYLESLTNDDNGVIASKASGIDEQISDLQERIEDLETRLTSREEVLRNQFAQLEQVVSASQNTLARLTAQLGSLGQIGR